MNNSYMKKINIKINSKQNNRNQMNLNMNAI